MSWLQFGQVLEFDNKKKMTQKLKDIFSGKRIPRVKIEIPSKEEMEKQLKEVIKEQKRIIKRVKRRNPNKLFFG